MIPPKNDVTSKDGDSVGTARTKKESDKRKKVAGWPGYVREGVFVIEKRIHGRKWHVSTRCTTLRAAMRQLERFEENPSRYNPGGEEGAGRLVLDEKLIEEFFAWHSAEATREWALNVRSLLFDWANHLKGKDLRHLELVTDLKSHLREARTQAPHRVKAIRSLCKWLRTERGLLTRQQDATLDLTAPQAKPAQWKKSKAVSWDLVLEVFPYLRDDVRDVLELLAATGWHISEVRRFAEAGTVRARDASDKPGVISVIGTKHKSGKPHFTALVHPQHDALARRIHARGYVIERGALRKQMLKAFAALNAERKKRDPDAESRAPFQLGSLRHSLTNWLNDAGITDEERGKYLGHSAATNAKHYVDAQRPPIVLPQRVLRVVD